MTSDAKDSRADAGREIELAIGGMTCASCAMRIERKLNKLDGVTATVNYATENAKVSYDDGVEPERLIEQVEAAGYSASLPQPVRSDTPAESTPTGGEDDPTRSLRQRLYGSLVLSVPVILLAMIPALQFTYWQWISLTLTAPVWCGRRGCSTGPPGRTCATVPPPWTPSFRWARWPRCCGRCMRCCSAAPVCRA